MKTSSIPAQRLPSLLDKPARERIWEAADRLFRIHGIRVGIAHIAREAESNSETVIKYFHFRERLVERFVKSLIDQAEHCWREVEAETLDDPEGRLRFWVFSEELRKDDPLGAERLLSRTALEYGPAISKDPMLRLIELYWQGERRRVVRLCEAASLREPRDLADKLLLLVHGLRNERGAYGHHAPSRLIQQAADDLMVAHGAASRPPLDVNN